jgi:hypothetical protein
MAALPVTLYNKQPTHINRRRQANLPSHVTGNAQFTTLFPTECGYIIDLTNIKIREVNRYTVEFLKVNGSDNWYLLEQQNGHWFTGKQNCVQIINNYGLGW